MYTIDSVTMNCHIDELKEVCTLTAEYGQNDIFLLPPMSVWQKEDLFHRRYQPFSALGLY